jgi:hypothetical protein
LVNYIKNDIAFSYNQTYNKIVFKGQTADYYYLPASYSDPNIFDPITPLKPTTGAALRLGVVTNEYVPPVVLEPTYLLGGYAGNGQPWTVYRTLNMRLGWTWNGNTASIPDYKNQFRPVPTYVFNYGSIDVFKTVKVLTTLSNTALTYANLVNTATVIVFLDIVAGSTQDSTGAGGVLGSVPLNIQNNGVGFFDKVLSQKLTKIPSQLQELRFTFKDEQGNPFLMPNSAVVNLEIGVEY